MQINSTPLPPIKQEALYRWLELPEFDTLIEILESGRFDVQMKAVKYREHGPDTRAVADAGELDERAREISRTIDTLISMKQQKEPFTISSANP